MNDLLDEKLAELYIRLVDGHYYCWGLAYERWRLHTDGVWRCWGGGEEIQFSTLTQLAEALAKSPEVMCEYDEGVAKGKRKAVQ